MSFPLQESLDDVKSFLSQIPGKATLFVPRTSHCFVLRDASDTVSEGPMRKIVSKRNSARTDKVHRPKTVSKKKTSKTWREPLGAIATGQIFSGSGKQYSGKVYRVTIAYQSFLFFFLWNEISGYRSSVLYKIAMTPARSATQSISSSNETAKTACTRRSVAR